MKYRRYKINTLIFIIKSHCAHVSNIYTPLCIAVLDSYSTANCNSRPSEFGSLADFYPFYLCEHSLPITKLFHFVATFNVSLFLLMVLRAKATSTKLRIFFFGLVQAYGLAWISHFFVEKNKPATFKYPVYSFFSDWMMFKDALTGKVLLFEKWFAEINLLN